MDALAVLRSCTPQFFRRGIGAVRDRCKKVVYRIGLRIARYDIPNHGICLNYAGVLTEQQGSNLHGGAVKLVHLQDRFPENPRAFNIVYLVSSAQPRFAAEYAGEMKRRGAKIVWNQNGVAYPGWAKGESAKTNQNMRVLLQLADYVVYQSDFCRMCADKFLGTAQVPWQIIYNCVDTSVFSPRRRHARTDEPLVLLAAGTHQQKERVLTALQVLHLLQRRGGRRFVLNIAGPLDWPNAAADVESVIQQLKLQQDVNIIPAFDQKDAPELYRSADILLHLKYKDPCPTAVIEAMACGVPVIGSNSGGMPELLGRNGGLLLDVPESWDTMFAPAAEKVVAAVENISEHLPQWTDRCRDHSVELFDSKRWLLEHERVFTRLVA